MYAFSTLASFARSSTNKRCRRRSEVGLLATADPDSDHDGHGSNNQSGGDNFEEFLANHG
jgi:hypothetical protein